MPFSTTPSCTEEEWTDIFENVFKPAVEGAGLDYECRRSVPTRGNLVATIIRDLNDAYVVIADLTDQNPNVYYELGVRHSLKDRTILVSQKREDIRFDLGGYASHIYVWKTQRGKRELAKKLRELLEEVDTNPERPDNPVRDFLGRLASTSEAVPESITTSDEAPLAKSLVGLRPQDAAALARLLAAQAQPPAALTVYRLSRQELRPLMAAVQEELNSRNVPQGINREQVLERGREFISEMEPLVVPIERFCLASVEERWSPGVNIGLRFASDWITVSERPNPGRNIRFAKGTPALLAWRLIILMGAKALAEEAFDLVRTILTEPIEVEESGGQFSNLPFPQRLDLFYPEAFLGYANIGITYIAQIWATQPHMQELFESEEDYHLWVAQFLMLVALADAKLESERPLYPGYKLIPQARRAMEALRGRLISHGAYRQLVTSTLGIDPTNLNRVWPALASQANKGELGAQHFADRGVRFPEQIEGS